jgi:hypothetical protein
MEKLTKEDARSASHFARDINWLFYWVLLEIYNLPLVVCQLVYKWLQDVLDVSLRIDIEIKKDWSIYPLPWNR